MLLAVFAVFALSLASCASNAPISEDLSAKQLIQNGQDNFDGGRYKAALRYYNAALERFGENDPAVYVEAKYEIGHIYMKRKKYESARNVFTEITDLYSATMPGMLPGAYLKLSQIELEKIEAKGK